MFGIPSEYEREIAHMEGNHTWAVFYMTGEDHPYLERSLSRWIERFATDYTVFEIVRSVLFLFMEHRAIIALFDRYSRMSRDFEPFLPVLRDSFDAACFSARFIHNKVENKQLEDAAVIMEKMFKGHWIPFDVVKIPYPQAGRYVDPNDPFFPVGMRPLFWGNCQENDFDQYVPTRFYGIVDLENGYTFSSVTWKYCLYTNKQVYDLMVEIAGLVFGVIEKESILDDFKLSRTRGSCRMIVKRAEEEYQPQINDGWQAVLVGVNSYDTTCPLRYTFGFKNVAYRASFLMDDYTVSIQTAHVIPFDEFREKVLDEINDNYEFRRIEEGFRNIIQQLKTTRMSEFDMLPLFCKYFRIKAVPVSDEGKEQLVRNLHYVEGRIKANMNKFKPEDGKNAYTMLHVMMDYISWFDKPYTYDDQIAFGKWVKEFLSVSRAPGFSISRYIGNEAYDVVSWYGAQ